MTNENLQEFVVSVIARGPITFGDVRRLERGCLPGGITNREELETLITLNAKIVRADKAWAQWLVAAIVDFVATPRVCEHPTGDAAGEWVDRLIAAPATSLGRRIARQVRCELARRAIQSTSAEQRPRQGRQRSVVQQSYVHQSYPAGVAANHLAMACSEILLGPSHRAALQLMRNSVGLSLVPSMI
jgi:hypothetical protein